MKMTTDLARKIANFVSVVDKKVYICVCCFQYKKMNVKMKIKLMLKIMYNFY
jgi:hypothetical protein